MDTIDDIMDNFDFERVHAAMRLLGWCWVAQGTKGYGVPEISELRKCARRLMKNAMKSPLSSYTTGTGGFQVDKTTEEDKVYLSLSFVLTNFNNYD